MTTAIDRVSLELTNRCGKGCAFCYNGSKPGGATHWTGAEVIAFATDCAAHGVAALSLGGGEPLDHPDVFDVLTALDGVMFRSLTTHGLHLDAHLSRLLASRPDKVHLSIHQPGHPPEVDRVIEQVATLADHGVKSGVNLLVARSALASAAAAARRLAGAGIGPDRIVYLPMRGRDTPSADELAAVAGTARF
jgi:MoaA/NifB/PqqE/SkfB family radical SAM enzyme